MRNLPRSFCVDSVGSMLGMQISVIAFALIVLSKNQRV